jgi:uncharacterized protein (DUF433 family)
MAMEMVFETQTVPVNIDPQGVIRVQGTRVRLDTVIYAFNEGYTAEEIVSQYPVLRLADVYAVVAYYLNHRDSLDEYLRQRVDTAAKIRAEIEQKPEYQHFRERLLARRQQPPGQVSRAEIPH